jgi:prepilin-type N-terminal cleavage/methylation domain-containing protein
MNRRGFSYVELMVVMAMLVVVIGIAIPVVWKLRENSNRSETKDNLRRLGLAVHAAVGDFKKVPPAFDTFGKGFGNALGSNEPATLFVHLFPYVGHKDDYDNDRLVFVRVFHAPSDPTDGGESNGTSYVANSAVFCDSVPYALGGRGRPGTGCSTHLTTSMPNGTSNVIMFVTGALNSKGVRDYSVFKPEGGGAFSSTKVVSLPQWSWDFRSETADANKFQPFGPVGILTCMGDANIRIHKEDKPNGFLHAMKTNDPLHYDFEKDELFLPPGDF